MDQPRSAGPPPPQRKLRSLTAGVAVLGAIAAALVVVRDPGLGPLHLVVVLAAATAFTRLLPFVIVRGGEGEETSVDDALIVVMLVALPGVGTLVASLAGTAAAHVLRRRSTLKSVYNHGVQAIAVSAAVGVHALLSDGGAATRSTQGLVAAGAGAVTYSVLSSVLVRLVVAVASRAPISQVMRDGVASDVIVAVSVIGWGMLAVGVTSQDVAATALVAVPMGGAWLFRRSERQRSSMRALLDAAVVVGEAVPAGTVAATLAGSADRVLGRSGSRLERRAPAHGEIGMRMDSRSGPLWLVAGRRHRWDQRRREDQILLGALAAVGEIALENAALLDEAGRDPDTGLVTGALLQDRLQVLVDQHAAAGSALVAVRIPRFDIVKRALGPVAARRELAEVSGRLQLLGEELNGAEETPSVVGYLGGGDFVLAVAPVASPERALGVARMTQRELLRPVTIDGVDLAIEASIGVRIQPGTGEGIAPVTLLIRDAVAGAVTAARRSGPRRIQLVDPNDDLQEATVFAVEARLRAAMDRSELAVHYQPVVAMETGEVIGAEALVRWHDPDHGVIGPNDFVPIAEGSALIVDLDRYVLRRAVAELASWSRLDAVEHFTMAVNLSAAHLAEPDTAAFVSDALDAAGVAAPRLIVEVTESSVMPEASAALATLEALAERGVNIAVDDFGTGYSSLLYLRDFPVGELKIDRSFVSRMTESGGDAAIVTAIVRLAQTLGLRTVAEGVETEEQLAALRSLGCDAGQGYLWAQAMEAREFAARWLPPGRVPVGSGAPTEAGPVPGADAVWGRSDESVRDDELAYVVHEMRSPITAIDGFAYLMAHDVGQLDEPGELPAYVDRIRHGVRTLQSLVDALHDSSTANLGGMALDREPAEINELVRSTLDAMAPALGTHPVRWQDGPPVQAAVDQFRIGQVLRNLLSNAAKFSDPDAPIDVSLTVSAGRCRVAVRDRGCGVPSDRRQELFRRFARLGATTTGMGIGLHNARTIARRHGGDVTYEPASDGPGSIFALELPVVRDGR